MLLDEVVLFNHSEISPEDFDVSRTVWRLAWGMCALGEGVFCETGHPPAHPLSLSLFSSETYLKLIFPPCKRCKVSPKASRTIMGVRSSMAQERQSVLVTGTGLFPEGYIGPGDSVSRSSKT